MRGKTFERRNDVPHRLSFAARPCVATETLYNLGWRGVVMLPKNVDVVLKSLFLSCIGLEQVSNYE